MDNPTNPFTPQEAHCHAGVIYLIPLTGINQGDKEFRFFHQPGPQPPFSIRSYLMDQLLQDVQTVSVENNNSRNLKAFDKFRQTEVRMNWPKTHATYYIIVSAYTFQNARKNATKLAKSV